MNTYQEKLQSIKARRLSTQQRVNSLLKCSLWILAAICFVPFAFGATWRFFDLGYGSMAPLRGWVVPLYFIFAVLNSLSLIVLFLYSLVRSKKLLVRSLSGIKES